MKHHPRLDANQQQIVKALRQIPNVSVVSLASIGSGCPDLLIGVRHCSKMQRNYLVELKDGCKNKASQNLTDDEITFQSRWNGHCAVCNSLDAVLRACKIGITKGDRT